MGKSGPTPGSLALVAVAFASALMSLGPGPSQERNPDAQSIVSASQNATGQIAGSTYALPDRPYSLVLEELKEENDWKNDLILFWLSSSVRESLPRIVASWLRNYIATLALYFGVGAGWAYYIYWCFGEQLFGSGNMPTVKDVTDQMKVAFLSTPLYAMLPALTEALVERGYTKAYSRISDVGVWRYWGFFALYMISVEFFVYWQHRGLHDITLGYRLLHNIHHKYNKEHSMSPFAGLAFHPLDGILQALPYCWTLFYVPMHFLTHELLLFATGVWTANIHDNLHARIEPIMGAGYHTIHHTAYRFNYGHYTTIMDAWWGTLLSPEDYPEWLRSRAAKSSEQKQNKGSLPAPTEVAVNAVAQ